jgi:hypothetical protein
MRVDLFGRQLVQGAGFVQRMVDDERVDRRRRRDGARRRVRVGEVGGDVDVGVAVAEAVREDARAACFQAARDRIADAAPAVRAGDERGSQVVRTPTTSRTASDDVFSACCSSSERSSSMICSIPFGPSLHGTPM